jgi:transcription elongation GreA/GreB family factor
MQLAFDERHTAHPVGTFLRSEVHRAIVLDDPGHHEDVVRLNAWIKYQLDARRPKSHFLVHPEDYAAGKRQLSVFSPVGAALIGIRVGDPMPFVSTEGQLRLVTALTVDQVPARRDDGKKKQFNS